MAVSRPQPSTPPERSSLRRVAASGGLSLAVESWPGTRPTPLVFAHGFGQTRHAWRETAARLAGDGWTCHAADGRGHGDSGWMPGGEYAFDQFLGDVSALTRDVGSRPVWIGASMSGLLGLVAEAESSGGLFEALVLAVIAPFLERFENPGSRT